MAGTNNNSGSPSAAAATPGLDAQQQSQASDGADRATRLKVLLEQVRSRSAQLTSAARTLVVEVDGVTVAMTEGQLTRPFAFELPFDGRSLTLRDENGHARAHCLLDGKPCPELDYDGGRLALAIERDDDARKVTLVLRCIDQSAPTSTHTHEAR